MWCQLRHYLGRLYSYRRVADIIVETAKTRPDLFRDTIVTYIPSAFQKRIATPKSSSTLREVICRAFPQPNSSQLESEIFELQNYGIDEKLSEQLQIKNMRAGIHAEIHLHDHLEREGKTRAAVFWDSCLFIATGKPPCCLCYLYFNDPGNDFQLQSPHMNLYPKWRLPEVHDDQNIEAKQHFEEQLQEIIEQLQQDTLDIIKQKVPRWKRNDSRTDSHGGFETDLSRHGYSTGSNVSRRYSPDLDTREQAAKMHFKEQNQPDEAWSKL